MAIKIDIETNIDEDLNDVESCQKAIDELKQVIVSIRTTMYARFLHIKMIILPLLLSVALLFIYYLTGSEVCLYLTPVPVIVMMVYSVFMAEHLTQLISEEITLRIDKITRRMQQLMQES